MRALGIPVALGQDCVMDPWYGLGGADMLDVAHMAVHGAPMTSREAIRWTFDAVTEIPARILGLENYGVAVGANADLVLLQAADPIEAVRLRATRLLVLRRGAGHRANAGARNRAGAHRPAADARSGLLRARLKRAELKGADDPFARRGRGGCVRSGSRPRRRATGWRRTRLRAARRGRIGNPPARRRRTARARSADRIPRG